jgi:hypothetical protein
MIIEEILKKLLESNVKLSVKEMFPLSSSHAI